MNTLSAEILEKLIRKYLPSHLFKKYQHEYSSYYETISAEIKNRKRTVSKASLLKYSKDYAANLITFVNANIPENSLPQFILNIGEAFYAAGFDDAAVILLSEVLTKINTNERYKSIYSYALLALGRVYSDKYFWRKSNGLIRKSEKIFIQLNDINGLVRCNNLLGIYHAENGSLQKSVQYFMKCLSLLEKEDNDLLTALIEMNIGAIYLWDYNFAKSLYFSQRAILKFDKNKELKNIALAKYNIAFNFYHIKRYDLSLKMLEQCSSISRKGGMLEHLGKVYHTKALVYLEIDDMKMAVAYWYKSLEIFERINHTQLKYKLSNVRGLIAKKQKKYKFSEKCFLDGKKLLLKFNHKIYLGETEYEMAMLYAEWGKIKKAQVCFETALQIFKKLKIDYMTNKIENDRKKLLDL